MSFIITKEKPLNIYLLDKNITSVNIALSSFIRDLTVLFTKPNIIENINDADIVLSIKELGHPEEYRIEITNEKIFIIGNDDLGLIYGIYRFLEKELSVHPLYLMEGIELCNINSVTLINKTISSYPKTRFRGWFINDEDLLGGFKTLGKREVNYEYYHDVIHPDMMKRIAETALRCCANLLIPSTLVDLTNPYEENLVKICSEMGLYISQHHIEPLGVSKLGFSKFAKANNYDEGFSYISNKDALVECWKYYLKLWSKYPRIVFQTGLRGGTDRPVWANEKMSERPEDRGELISSAITEQFNLIKEIYPYDINVTSTLWMEGADLLRGGYLNIPNEIWIVFADIGMSQLFGDDFFNVSRDINKKYGVYYHAAYWHTGPHLAEGVIPEKMCYAYQLLKEYKSDYYSVLNVSNIKDLTFSIYLNSKLTWNNEESLSEIYDEYASLYFKNKINKEKLIQAIKTYYSALGDVGEEQYERFCKKYNFSYRKYEGLDFPVVSFNDGMFKSIIWCFYYEDRELLKTPKLKEVCLNGLPIILDAYNQFLELSKQLPCGYSLGFNEHWTYQSLFFSHLFKSGVYLYDATELLNKREYIEAEKLLKKSSDELKNILNEREIYYQGEYKNWFNDERKTNIKLLIRRIPEDLDRAKEYFGDK